MHPLIREAAQLLAELAMLYRRMGHGPDGADDPLTESDPYNCERLDRVDHAYGRAEQRMARRQARYCQQQ